MEYDLSRMTVDERIVYHMERVAREEVLYEIKRRIRTGLTTGELRVQLAETRDSIELCENVIEVMENPKFIEGVDKLSRLVSGLKQKQKIRSKLLSERYSKGKLNEVEYSKVMKEYFMLLDSCVVTVLLIEEISHRKRLNADKYVKALFNFDGFEERYDECVEFPKSSHTLDLKSMTSSPTPMEVPLEKVVQVT